MTQQTTEAKIEVTPVMEVAGESDLMRQLRASRWETAKDVAEGLDLAALYLAMSLVAPKQKVAP